MFWNSLSVLGVVVIPIEQGLSLGPTKVQSLLVVCWRFAMENLWQRSRLEIRLNNFCRPTIAQDEFITIIIIIIIIIIISIIIIIIRFKDDGLQSSPLSKIVVLQLQFTVLLLQLSNNRILADILSDYILPTNACFM